MANDTRDGCEIESLSKRLSNSRWFRSVAFGKRDERGEVEDDSEVRLRREVLEPGVDIEIAALCPDACRGETGDVFRGPVGDAGATAPLSWSDPDGGSCEGTDTAIKVSTSRARRIRSNVA